MCEYLAWLAVAHPHVDSERAFVKVHAGAGLRTLATGEAHCHIVSNCRIVQFTCYNEVVDCCQGTIAYVLVECHGNLVICCEYSVGWAWGSDKLWTYHILAQHDYIRRVRYLVTSEVAYGDGAYVPLSVREDIGITHVKHMPECTFCRQYLFVNIVGSLCLVNNPFLQGCPLRVAFLLGLEAQ